MQAGGLVELPDVQAGGLEELPDVQAGWLVELPDVQAGGLVELPVSFCNLRKIMFELHVNTDRPPPNSNTASKPEK